MTDESTPQTRRLAKPYPISAYPETIAELNEIKRFKGESHGSIIRRLVSGEVERIRRIEVPKSLVWAFPSYAADDERMDTRVVFLRSDGQETVFEALGDRLRPEPPVGSYIAIGESPDQRRGQVSKVERAEVEGLRMLVITVRELNPALKDNPPAALFEYVTALNEDLSSRMSLSVVFDPFRTTPSWKRGENEVRAMLVGLPGKRARQVRFFPFKGADRTNPSSEFFPLADIDDYSARLAAIDRIAHFLEHGALPTEANVSQ